MNSNQCLSSRGILLRSLGASLFIFCTSALSAQDRSLSLLEAQARAEAGNPGLQALAERYEGVRQRIPQSRALPDPRVQVTYFGESIQTRTGPQEAAYAFTQTLPWWSKLGRREDYASSEAAVVGLSYGAAALNLKREVALAYYETAYLGKAQESTRENLQLLRDLQSIVDARVRGGGGLNQLLRLDVELERNADRLTQLQQQAIAQRARLRALLGEEGISEAGRFLVVLSEPELPELVSEFSELAAALRANNPELLSLKQSIESAQFRAELAKLERYPDVTFGLNYIDLGTPILASSPDAGKDPWGVSIAIQLPIWEGKNRAGIREAQAMERSAEALYRDRVLQMEASLLGAVARRDESIRRVERYRDRLLPLADQALENTRSGYESGGLSVLDLIDSERALHDLQVTYWRAVADLNQAEAVIHALIGSHSNH